MLPLGYRKRWAGVKNKTLDIFWPLVSIFCDPREQLDA
jgi:hypothetical protein